MKLVGLIAFLIGLGIVYAYPQDSIVPIPDSAFLYALINEGVDSNGDSLISYTEARNVQSLAIFGGVYQFNVFKSLEGLNAFVNLRALLLGSIASTSIDFAMLEKLEYLGIGFSGIKKIDVSQNTHLRVLELVITCIYDIDLSNNTALERVVLKPYPFCEGSSQKNVCVWTLPFPPEGVILETSGDPERKGYHFTTLCSDYLTPDIVAKDILYPQDSIMAASSKDGMIYLVPEKTGGELAAICEVCFDSVEAIANTFVSIPLSSLENGDYWLYARDTTGRVSRPESFSFMGVGVEDIENEIIGLFPNPTSHSLTIKTQLSNCQLEIYTLNGQRLLRQEMDGSAHLLDLSSFQSGVYFITVRSKDFEETKKIIRL